MGLQTSFSGIEKKYGKTGVDYVVSKYQQRRIISRISDEIKRLSDHAEILQKQDLNFLEQEKRKLKKAFDDTKRQVQEAKKGTLKELEIKKKLKVEQFSGYIEKAAELDKLQQNVKSKYATEKAKMDLKVRDQVKKHKSSSTLAQVPEYDCLPDNYKRSIEDECLKKYPERKKTMNAHEITDLQKKLTWDNYKQNFESILARDQVQRGVNEACLHIKSSLSESPVPICC